MRILPALFGTLLSFSLVASPLHQQSATTAPAEVTKGTIASQTDFALDLAQRWSQSVLDDSANITPLERDLVLVRLGHLWKERDPGRAKELLQAGLSHLKGDAQAGVSDANAAQYNFAVQTISTEVREVDPAAWDKLVNDLPPWGASEMIAREAQSLAVSGDIPAALELEKKSLERGGSMTDSLTLVSTIQSDRHAAGQLFDEILQTASKPEADPNLLLSLVQDVFDEDNQPAAKDFFNQERKQRTLDVLAKRLLIGNEGGCNYSVAANLVMQHFATQLQGQLQTAINNCKGQDAGRTRILPDDSSLPNKSTDDLVKSMEAAPDARTKAQLRELAIRHAIESDKNYERAIRLCLQVSAEEKQSGYADRFDNMANMYASQAIRASLKAHDVVAEQNILNLLAARIRSEVDLTLVRNLEQSDRQRALLALADMRRALEEEDPLQPGFYSVFLRETSKLSPSETTAAWRVVVSGLNRMSAEQRAHAEESPVSYAHKFPAINPMYGWFAPPFSSAEEGFVRASIQDLDSPEFREEFRLGIIEQFLQKAHAARRQSGAETSAK